jgi:biotin synthase-related radical SAM superfamily protein
MLADMSPNLQNPDYTVPQLTHAALMFGAFGAHLAARQLAGEEVRKEIVFDTHQAARTRSTAMVMRARWPIEAVRMAIARRRMSRASGG